MRMGVPLILIAVGLVLTACVAAPGVPAPTSPATVEPRACTLIGCVDGLTVRFTGRQPESFTLEASAAGVEPLTVKCPSEEATAQCRLDEVFLPDFTPEEVTLRITWEGGQVERTVRPTYTLSRPNGPDCPPECRQGVVELDLTG